MAWAPSMCLDGVVDKITVPFLVTHGSGDRQIPIEFAHQTYEQAVNSPKRELRIFTPDDYAIEHCEAEQWHRRLRLHWRLDRRDVWFGGGIAESSTGFVPYFRSPGMAGKAHL